MRRTGLGAGWSVDDWQLAGTVAGTTGLAFAASPITITDNHQVADDATEEYTTINVNGGGTLGIARNAKVVGTDVTVGAGGTITSAKNLHIGTPGSGQANTGLRANTLTLGGTSASLGQARALHLSLFNDGLVTINQYGKLTLDSINNDTASTWGGGKLTINGGTLDIANLSIAYDKLVGTDTAGSLILTNGGQFTVRDTLSITGDSFTNTLGGGIQAGKLVMESGKSYTHNTGAVLRLTGMTADGSFYTGDTFTVSQGKVFFGAEGNSPFRNHTTTATIAVGGTGSLEVAHGNWKTGAVTQTGGMININSKGVMVVDSLNQTGGLFTVGGSVNSGKLVVNGAVGNVAYSAGSAGINMRHIFNDIVLPVTATTVLMGLLKRGAVPDDPKEYAKDIGFYMLSGYPFARDLGGFVEYGMEPGLVNSLTSRGIADPFKMGKRACELMFKEQRRGDEWEKFLKASLDATGFWAGIPSRPVWQFIDGGRQLYEGKTSNPLRLFVKEDKPKK